MSAGHRPLAGGDIRAAAATHRPLAGITKAAKPATYAELCEAFRKAKKVANGAIGEVARLRQELTLAIEAEELAAERYEALLDEIGAHLERGPADDGAR